MVGPLNVKNKKMNDYLKKSTFTVKNKYGIDIVKCCASCIHNQGAKTEFTRECDAGEGEVKPSSYCTAWRMKPALDNAGRSTGRVKKKAWIEYVKLHGKSEQAVRDFERKFGSIYYDGRPSTDRF